MLLVDTFANGHHERCTEELAAIRDTTYRFGGSHAQRDVFTRTLVEAANRPSFARHYLAERRVMRPSSALGWRWDQSGVRSRQ